VTYPAITVRVPDWVEAFCQSLPPVLPSVDDRLRVAIELARRNVGNGTGGPFGAAVFDDAGRLVAPGVNLVVPSRCSLLHAEVVALALAQQRVGRWDLSDGGRERYELCASSEPCAMCFGAVSWSGVSHLVCGARAEDAQAVGFDEGPKPDDWLAALEARGIEVVRDLLRAEAVAVLRDYARRGGIIYNPGR
jgi:tRNA(Arg) A34 adenosine deaminase TadA